MLKRLFPMFYAAADARAELEIVNKERDKLKALLADLRQTVAADEAAAAALACENRILRAAAEGAMRREMDTALWIARRFYGEDEDGEEVHYAEIIQFPNGNDTVN